MSIVLLCCPHSPSRFALTHSGKFKAVGLSTDHKPERADEKKRIIECKGRVEVRSLCCARILRLMLLLRVVRRARALAARTLALRACGSCIRRFPVRIHCWAARASIRRAHFPASICGAGLAMTRSFGDVVASSVGVISKPEITEMTLGSDDSFIILAR